MLSGNQAKDVISGLGCWSSTRLGWWGLTASLPTHRRVGSTLILTPPQHMASVNSQLCVSLVECCRHTNPQQIVLVAAGFSPRNRFN